MKKLSLFLSVFIVAILASHAEKVFYASYDKTFSADKAKGNPNAETKEEVNLETLGFYLKKGLKGRALLNGLSDESKPLNLIYNAENNINEKQGTILFWVRPVNWKGSDKNYQLLFEAKGTKSWLLIYKYQNSSDLLFLFGQPDNGKKPYKWSVIRSNVKAWNSTLWHFIACTWTKNELQLYIDGQLKGIKKNNYPAETPFNNFAVGGLYPHKWKPLGKQTLIDELRIYNKALSKESIYKKWVNEKPQVKTSKTQIGIGKKKAVIDGIINQNEYTFSGTGFFNLNGIYSHIQGYYYLSYDQDNIYLAVKSPVLKPFLKTHTEHDSKVYQDDSVEIFLSPKPESRQYYQFVFNANGAVLDAKVKDSNWNAAPFPVSNKVSDKFWTIEMAIPFKSLDIPTPQNNDVWQINICRSFPALKCYTSISPNKKSMLGYHDFEHFPSLQFIPNLPITNINKIGNLNKAELDLNVSYLNNSQTIQKYQSTAVLDSAGKCLINKKEEGELTSGKSYEFTAKKKNFGREGYLKLILTNQTSTIFKGEFAYKNTPPFDLVNIYTEIDKQNVIIKYKFNEIIGSDETLLIEMINKENGKTAVSKSVKPKDLIFVESLAIADVKPGFYELVTSLIKNGTPVYKLQRDIKKPEHPPVWADNKIGCSEIVPAPWTPLQVNEQDKKSWFGSLWNSVFSGSINKFELQCWGRSIQYTKASSFPTQITAKNQKLLAKPINLKIKASGKTLNFDDISFDLTEQKDTIVKLNSENSCSKIDIDVKTQLEYDGFMWFEINIKPCDDSAKIDSMTFDIPMTRQAGTLLHTLYKGYNRFKPGTGAIPENGWKANIFEKPIVWVGNEDVGIQWFAETLKGWDLKNENNSLSIIPQQDTMLIRLTLVDHPITLKKSKKIAFGLIATPTRPPMKDWRKIRLQKTIHPWYPYAKYFNYPDKNYVDKKHGPNPNFKKAKIFSLYHAIYGFTPLCPEWPYWAMQWERVPPPRGTIGDLNDSHWTLAQVCTNSKSYRDFYLYKISNAIKDMKIPNLYFDLGVPRVCHNHCHGCGWKDMNGNLRNTYNILGTRDIVKRIYTDFKRQQPNGLIINHMSEEPAMPVLSFADILVDGELYCLQVAEDESYYKTFTPDMFRAAFLSRQWGPLQCYIPQFERASIVYRPNRKSFWKTPEAQPAIQHFIGYMLAHDTKCWPIFRVKFDKIWKIQDEFGWDDKVNFIPYWNNNNPIKVLNNKNNRIMLSTYEREGKYMFVLFNDTDKNQNLTIKSTLKKPLTNIIDALSGKQYSFNDNHLNVQIPKRSYILFVEK